MMGAAYSELVSELEPPIAAPSPQARDRVRQDLLQAAGNLPEFSKFLQTESNAVEILLAALSLSPYLFDIATGHPESAWQALTRSPPELMDDLAAQARRTWKESAGQEPELMKRLRCLKRDMAFAAALYDLSRLYETRRITRWLSAFATAALASTVDHLLFDAYQTGKVKLPDVDDPGAGSGLSFIGMGKLGAGELNYSSDIDLIAIYDPAKSIVADPSRTSEVFSRLVRRLIHIMQERTRDGYVFRTDLRLRPDPAATPLAVSYGAAMLYYAARGQNWERAAFIKARCLAGDPETGSDFCAELRPFVFRKYLDYVAIADIHSIKRQIHAHRGHGAIAIRGHNIKLGRGGIREIEFFAQTQQLIAGGRMPELRVRATEDALNQLAEARWIDRETATSMLSAYWFLRDLEHRIQMRRDEQSHVVPEDDDALRHIALMMGFSDAPSFCEELAGVLRKVERYYAALFENEAGLAAESGNLVFTGDDDDPETLETLSSMGFERPSDVARIVRNWHYGRYRATQNTAAREALTEMMPQLLRALADTGRADEALLRFDAFLSGLPAGIQLFSVIGNNPGLLSLLVNIMGSAPRLAEAIGRQPHIFDGMLDPTLLAELPTRAYLGKRLDEFLDGDFAYEEILDRLRIFASEQRFLIGVRLLTRRISGARAGRAFSDLATLIIGVAVRSVEAELVKVHGRVAGGRVAVVGMGKLGSLEMTAGSDVDMILLYSHDADCWESDGSKPLDPPRYYARLTQRLVAALSAPTAHGVLYEVDLRLRPSGNKGPVAVRIQAFRKYQIEQAWTWEHMALTRARIVAGDADLGQEAEEIFSEVLDRVHDAKKTASDMVEMRRRIAESKPPSTDWDVKLISGGVIDIEFIAQYLRLQAKTFGIDPSEAGTRTRAILEVLGPPVIGEAATATLLEALSLYTEISQIMRLCLDRAFDPEEAPQAFRELLLGVCDVPDLDTLEARLENAALSVRQIFSRTLGDPDKEAISTQGKESTDPTG